jgi:hypothetical protein
VGPLFSAILIAILSAALLSVVFIVFRLFLTTARALRGAFGFVIGAGVGTALSMGILVNP